MVSMTGSIVGSDLRQITMAGEHVAEAIASLTAARKTTRGPVSRWYTSCDLLPPTRPLLFSTTLVHLAIDLSVTPEQGCTGEQALRRHCKSKP